MNLRSLGSGAWRVATHPAVSKLVHVSILTIFITACAIDHVCSVVLNRGRMTSTTPVRHLLSSQRRHSISSSTKRANLVHMPSIHHSLLINDLLLTIAYHPNLSNPAYSKCHKPLQLPHPTHRTTHRTTHPSSPLSSPTNAASCQASTGSTETVRSICTAWVCIRTLKTRFMRLGKRRGRRRIRWWMSCWRRLRTLKMGRGG